MQNNAIIKYALRVAIVLLTIAIYLVIEKQAEIRDQEDSARDLSRERMSILKEALNHYAQVNKQYTNNFDTLLYVIETDSILNQKKELVGLTTELLNEISTAQENPLLMNVFEIKKAIKELKAILEEVSDQYRQSTEVMEKTLQVSEDIQSFEIQNDFFDFASLLGVSDSINYLSIEIGQFTLQGAVDQTKNYFTLFKSHAPNANINGVAKYWADIQTQLRELEVALTAPGMEVQVFTNRYLKHNEIIQKRLTDLQGLNINSEIAKFDQYQSQVTKLGDRFVADHFMISSRSALKGLEKDEQVLVQINANTIFAPPLMEKKFTIEITNDGLGYKISCPNPVETVEFSVGLFSQRYKNYGSIDTGEKSWETN